MACVRIYRGGKVVASEVEHKATVTQAGGKMRVTPPDNGSEVKCEVTSPGSTTPKITSTRLSVLFPPREVMGSMVPSIAEEGAFVTLTCLTSSCNPPANLSWTSRGSPLAKANTTTTTTLAAFKGISTRSVVVLQVEAGDHGRRLLCEADNGLGSPLHKGFTLNVLYAPVWQDKPPAQIDVWEGSEVAITAIASANPGPVRYWWRRERETLVGAGGELRLGQATRSLTGNYTISAYSQRGAINTSFYLNVQYGPVSMKVPEWMMVDEGDMVDIECSASGNPQPRLIWTTSKNETVSTGVGVARLVLQSVRREDTGQYLCHASTSLTSPSPASPPQPAVTKLIVTQPVTVTKREVATEGSWASLGATGRLVCQVRAAPPPTFVWATSKGHKIQNNDKYLIHRPMEVDGLVTWASVLEVAHVSPQDYQPYHCSASNSLGSGSTTLTLRPPARPFPPSNLTVISVSNASVVLGWSPNLSGGQPLGYTVRYRPTGTLTFQYEDVPDGNSTGLEVGGLLPEVEYSLSAQARNNQGRSNYVTPPVSVTTLSSDGSRSVEAGHQLTSFLLLVIVASALGLLVLNVVFIACFMRRHNKKRNSFRSSTSTKTTSATTPGNTSTSSPEHHHRHHQVLLALNTLSHRKTKKPKAVIHTKQSKGKAANVMSLPSPSVQRNMPAHAGKSSKQTNVTAQRNKTFFRNGKIPQAPPFPKLKSKNSSLSPQAVSLRSGQPARHKHQTVSTAVAPEACSLIPSQGQANSFLPDMKQLQRDLDQISESSHESTETAIYCDNILPSEPELPLQVPERQNIQACLQHLNKELLQYHDSKLMPQQRQVEQGQDKSLQINNQYHSDARLTHPQSPINKHHNSHSQVYPVENVHQDGTSNVKATLHQYGKLDADPLPHKLQEPLTPSQKHGRVDQSILPPRNTKQSYSPSKPPLPHHHQCPPPASPSHTQPLRMDSPSPTRMRKPNQPLESPTRGRQHRATSRSPTILRHSEGSSESLTRTRRHRLPSNSPVRTSHHRDSSASPTQNRQQHRMPSELSVTARHHMDPAESLARAVHDTIFSESPTKHRHQGDLSESPSRAFQGALESPSRVGRNIASSESPTRTRQHILPSESSAKVVQQQNSPLTSPSNYHRVSPELLTFDQTYCESPTFIVLPQHQDSIPSPASKPEPPHTPAEPAAEQWRYQTPSSPLRTHLKLPESPVQALISHHSPLTSPTLHQHQYPSPYPGGAGPQSAQLSPEATPNNNQLHWLNSGTHPSSSLPRSPVASHPPLTSSSLGLPPTPPRFKKPRPSSTLHSSQPSSILSSTNHHTGTAVQLSALEHISEAAVLPTIPESTDHTSALQLAASPSTSPGKVPLSGGKDQEKKLKFREMLASSPVIGTLHRSGMMQGGIRTERYHSQGELSSQGLHTVVSRLASANTPVATSSPITQRRRTRFPDDFLWQGASSKT